MKRLSISEARRKLPRVIDELCDRRETVIITRHGKPVGRLVPCTQDDLDQEDALPLRGLPLVLSEDFDDSIAGDWEALAP